MIRGVWGVWFRVSLFRVPAAGLKVVGFSAC